MVAQVLEDEEPVSEVLRAPADDDLPRPGEREESRREVRGVADGRVVHAEVRADGADHDEARVDAHPHAELDAVRSPHFIGQRAELPLDRERSAQGAMGVVLVRDRRAEQRHHAVAQELVDRSLVAVHFGQDDFEGPIHDAVDVLGVEALGHGREARHVGEHHGDALAFSLQGALGGEDLLSEVLRRIRRGRSFAECYRLWLAAGGRGC